MQLIQLPAGWAIAVFVVLWFLLHCAASVVCHRIDEKYLTYNNALFKSRRFEQEGKLYSRFVKVKKWKKILPEIYPFRQEVLKEALYRKQPGLDSEKLIEKYLLESCRAELSHWLAITPFWIFGFFALPLVIIPCMLLYALAANLPCIIVQRYNRPRIAKHLLRTRSKLAGF